MKFVRLPLKAGKPLLDWPAQAPGTDTEGHDIDHLHPAAAPNLWNMEPLVMVVAAGVARLRWHAKLEIGFPSLRDRSETLDSLSSKLADVFGACIGPVLDECRDPLTLVRFLLRAEVGSRDTRSGWNEARHTPIGWRCRRPCCPTGWQNRPRCSTTWKPYARSWRVPGRKRNRRGRRHGMPGSSGCWTTCGPGREAGDADVTAADGIGQSSLGEAPDGAGALSRDDTGQPFR